MSMLSDEQTHPSTAQPHDAEDRLLAWKRVSALTGVSRTTAWRLERGGDFPARVQVTPGRVGWWESEITAWKRARGPAVLPPPGQRRAQMPPETVLPVSPPGLTSQGGARGAGRIVDRVASSPQKPPATPLRTRRDSRVAPNQMGFDF